MQFVSVYTVPAFNNSMGNFKECNGYFFSNFGVGKYNIEDIKKSSYIGLGHPFKSSKKEEKGIVSIEEYVQIKYIGEIIEILEFKIKLSTDKQKIQILSKLDEDENINRKYEEILIKQSEIFFKPDNLEFNSIIPLEMVLVKTKGYIEINENTLYPIRKIVPIALNDTLDYIDLNNYLDKIKLADDIILNTKNNYFVINGEEIEITGKHNKVYTLILKKIFLSKNKSFSINEFEKEFLNLTQAKVIKSDFYKNNIVKIFNKDYSEKVNFKLAFSLSKKLNINEIEEKINVIYIK